MNPKIPWILILFVVPTLLALLYQPGPALRGILGSLNFFYLNIGAVSYGSYSLEHEAAGVALAAVAFVALYRKSEKGELNGKLVFVTTIMALAGGVLFVSDWADILGPAGNFISGSFIANWVGSSISFLITALWGTALVKVVE